MLQKKDSLKTSNFKKLFKIEIEAISGDKPLRVYASYSNNFIKNLKFFLKTTAASCWDLADNIVETLLTGQILARNDVIKWQFVIEK
ncbi:hypothetical protein IQ259_17475 [Fortiea sp. LEGE XX443]|uniref:hypothetical protein n=1 Tax=Fortiea sp. LEGE XX443 TaxID=1828611 RepID=UPI00187E181C|nr:hypothetical protein [Fortiea sp. LEGE XX443]MBE9006808.1 hypothetical protein [Fortiea sp. LEGE XX443]